MKGVISVSLLAFILILDNDIRYVNKNDEYILKIDFCEKDDLFHFCNSTLYKSSNLTENRYFINVRKIIQYLSIRNDELSFENREDSLLSNAEKKLENFSTKKLDEILDLLIKEVSTNDIINIHKKQENYIYKQENSNICLVFKLKGECLFINEKKLPGFKNLLTFWLQCKFNPESKNIPSDFVTLTEIKEIEFIDKSIENILKIEPVENNFSFQVANCYFPF